MQLERAQQAQQAIRLRQLQLLMLIFLSLLVVGVAAERQMTQQWEVAVAQEGIEPLPEHQAQTLLLKAFWLYPLLHPTRSR